MDGVEGLITLTPHSLLRYLIYPTILYSDSKTASPSMCIAHRGHQCKMAREPEQIVHNVHSLGSTFIHALGGHSARPKGPCSLEALAKPTQPCTLTRYLPGPILSLMAR